MNHMDLDTAPPLACAACMDSPRLSFEPIIVLARCHHFLMVDRDEGGKFCADVLERYPGAGLYLVDI